MYRWLVTRLNIGLLAVLLLCLGGGQAGARTVLDLDVQKQPIALADWGDAWTDSSGRADLESVLKLPTIALQPTHSGLYPLRPGQVLWIRFTVPPAPDHERCTSSCPMPDWTG